ncbi:MAG: TnpV protein [Oscillospiraceae bacterium]|nr:TnpV protein [Oscillospiraceae bacterium]
MNKSFFEENGGTYSKVGDYHLPNLTLPDDGLGDEVYIGIWGMQRLDYLKKHKKLLYSQLLMSGNLSAHLHEIDVTATELKELIVEQMMKAQGVTEHLKEVNQMRWVGLVTNIRACVDEMLFEMS